MQNQTPPMTGISKVSYAISAIIPIVCLGIIANAFNWTYLITLLGVILAIPSVFALLKNSYHQLALHGQTTALVLITVIVSSSLWSSILNDIRPNISDHLLVLLLALVVAATQQLILLQRRTTIESTTSLNNEIENVLRGPPVVISFCVALIACGLTLTWLQATDISFIVSIAPKFIQRGIIPPITLSLFYWGLIILVGKWILLIFEFKNLSMKQSIFDEVYSQVQKSSKKIDGLFEMIWAQFEAFYILPRYINWAIPILGFIGTVLGISLATEGLSAILANNDSEFSQLLASALEPLGIAFDTTLIALSLSIILALTQTLLYRWEEKNILRIEESLRAQDGI